MNEEIELINMDDGVVILTDGDVLPIVGYFDDDGDECEPREATSIVAGRGGFWIGVTFSGERETIH